ncbi:N-acetyl-alpha-D-glucosaminyl L-malate synthase BshA [Salsuginibacillus kocurii]|uniref:N-acetyl-alpha-D-glucosaminyl L-malate synthase BshA n=1 Tax=Salsuginibacillus kocurii TaxID=427078 RepID=UPI000376591B|nr:N-acetyl-alpha-D-glucosaminyl L-malate synthase BshA [Salsuginibacillus kocurii]
MRPLNIGITCYPTVGGSGVVATELGKILAERGHNVHFISSSFPFRLDKVYPNLYFHEVEVNQYQVFQYPPYDLTLASKMAEVVRSENLDILHVHYAVPHAVCAKLAKDMTGGNVQVVTTLHGTDITVLGSDPTLKEVIRYGIEASDTVTAVSNSLAGQTNDLFHTTKHIETIYNFIDERVYDSEMKENLREEFGITGDERVIVHMSNFRPVKRTEDVFKAFEQVARHVPARLLLIGDGPERSSLMKQVKAANMEQEVLFLGNQKRVAELLQMADVMLLLSEKESFGLAALEAMAAGVPVIGTDIGGIPEVIGHNETGFIVPLGRPDLVSAHCVTLFNNPLLHTRFQQASKDRAQRLFSAAEIVSQYEKMYYHTLQRGGYQ